MTQAATLLFFRNICKWLTILRGSESEAGPSPVPLVGIIHPMPIASVNVVEIPAGGIILGSRPIAPLHFFAACVDYGRIQAADASVCLYHQFPLVTAGRCKGRKRRHLSRFRCAQSRRSRDITKRTYPVSFYGWLLSIRSEVKLCELDRIAAYYLADFEAEVLPLLACDIEVVLYTLEVVGRQTAVACHGGDG